MIRKTTPLSIAESISYVKDPEIKTFMKKFTALSDKKADELRGKLNSLNLIKLNDKHLSKILDFLPEDKDELSKILPDSNLDENETNTILSTIKEHK
ncbi:MAG: hypothetical protein Q8Q04_01060 [archaeon]|nr:hypothetical protein [archaeon]